MDVKGFYFSLDAILGAALVIGGLLLLADMTIQEQTTETIDFLSKDLLTSLTEIKIHEVNNAVITTMIADGDIENLNNSLLEQLGEFWSQNQTTLAINFTGALVRDVIPQRFGVSLGIGGEDFLYQNNSLEESNLVASRRMVTGVKKGAAFKGSTASAYLKRIETKITSSFLYYGGFTGQGTIVGYLRDLPSDITNTSVVELIMEGDMQGAFDVYINGDNCGSFTATSGNMSADRWDLGSCNSSIVAGDNLINITFPDINDAYIGGGFIKVTYMTDEPRESLLTGVDKHWLPGLDGVVNLYDSFFVPGTLNALSVYLHYFADHTDSNNTFYITIGNATVYADLNSTTEQFVFLGNPQLDALLNYTSMSLATIPIRLGFENLSYLQEYTGAADVMLVTDVSGSMEWRMDTNNIDGTRRNCNDPNLNTSSTTRLSVAKCLDVQFTVDIINITGNEIGLISYEDTTETTNTINPTTNVTLLNQTIGIASPQTGYGAGGGTCVCCGINSAYDVLTGSIISTNLVNTGTSWRYRTGFFGPPPVGVNGTEWYEMTYDDSSWSSGNAVLGSNENGVGPAIVTDMGNTLSGTSLYPELWDMDPGTLQVEFSSGYNQTGNTFGESGGVNNDGWDSYYGYYSNIGIEGNDTYMNTDPNEDGDQSDNTVAADNEVRIFIGNNWDDDNPGSDQIPGGSAFGIEFYINSSMYSLLSSGDAILYFDWTLDPTGLDPGEEGWIKAQFGTLGSMNYLGTDLDTNGTQSDATPEVFWCEDTGGSAPDPNHVCPNPGSDTFVGNLTQYITAAGWYYLAIGAIATEEVADTTWDENWRFYFDNIYIEFANATDRYYLRKSFNITNINNARRAIINLMSDDKADVYFNGNLIHQDTVTNIPQYWNTRGINVHPTYITTGENVIAVKLENSRQATKFDLEFIGFNNSRELAMMVMSDGVATQQCARQSTGSSTQDAIQAACDAKENYGITVYSVGISDAADVDTLSAIAACGEGGFASSNDISELQEFYKDVAQTIISASRQSQTVVISGNYAASTLYPDSYIQINYTPGINSPGANEISATFQTGQLGGCNANVDIYPGMRILEGRVTSYSGDHWTDQVVVNGNYVFNLSEFGLNYTRLGDPFTVYIPPQNLVSGTNSISLRTGNDNTNNTGCSANNTFVYTGAINLSTSRTEVVEVAVGCNWQVEFNTGGFSTFSVPPEYSGTNNCYYSSDNITFNNMDAYDIATYQILNQLDFFNNGTVFVDFTEEDLEVVVTLVSQVPYLWGPAIAEVRAWE